VLTGAARQLGIEKFAYYRWNPRAFAHDMFRTTDGKPLELQDYQAEILEAVAHGKDVTVRSGHGVGKSTTDAIATFHFLCTRPYSLVGTTAPTFRQVKEILWGEIASLFQRFRLRDHFELQKTRLSVRGAAKWGALGFASNKPENVEGLHAPHVLAIVDEAKGVQKAIYDALDGALTTGGQRLYTSTPGSRVGQFYESHFGRIARYFHQVHINAAAVSAPWINRKWQEQKAEEWGLDSPIYQSKVLGEFPNEGDDILIRLDYILAAEASELEEKCSKCGKLEECGCDAPSVPAIADGPHEVLGCDVARYGMDETALARGNSRRIKYVRTWQKRDLVFTSEEIAAAYKASRLADETHPIESCGVDDTGLGGGVTDMLAKIYQVPNQPIIFGARTLLVGDPNRDEHFHNNKAFLGHKFKQVLEENFRERATGGVGTFCLPKDDKLKGQLSNLRVRHTNKGKLQIIDPDDPTIPIVELPKGVRVSPDKAHAAIICYHTATSSAGLAVGKFTPPDRTPPRHEDKRRVSRFIFGPGNRMRRS
jgi:phage terminase large subunit